MLTHLGREGVGERICNRLAVHRAQKNEAQLLRNVRCDEVRKHRGGGLALELRRQCLDGGRCVDVNAQSVHLNERSLAAHARAEQLQPWGNAQRQLLARHRRGLGRDFDGGLDGRDGSKERPTQDGLLAVGRHSGLHGDEVVAGGCRERAGLRLLGSRA